MSWQGIEGHDEIVERFRRVLARGRLASTFLFVGPSGIGKRTFALRLSQSLLCQRRGEAELDPCGDCDACVQCDAGTHPDLLLVRKPDDRSFIPVESFIGAHEKRMQAGLCHDLGLKPFMGGRRIAVIDDADDLNEEGANCLLKTLEEPPPRSVLILIGTSASRQLPTIRSRSQVIRFSALAPEVVERLLVSTGITGDAETARRLATASGGTLDGARRAADDDLRAFQANLVSALSDAEFDSVALAKETTAFVEAAGKEAASRRERMRMVVSAVARFHRALARGLCQADPMADEPLLAEAVERAMRVGAYDVDSALGCVERSLDALEQVDRNVNASSAIECWLDDLSRIALPSI